MNKDIKKRVTSHNVLTIIDEETIRHLSSWKDLFHKEKEDKLHYSDCLNKNLTPILHSTQKAQHPKVFSMNNTSKFLSQNQKELNKKVDSIPENKKTVNPFKHKIPVAHNKTPLRLSPTNLKKIDIRNTFFNSKAISTNPYNFNYNKSKKKLLRNRINKTNSNSINKSSSNKRYSSRRNSNDIPTRSDSNSHNNSRKNIEQFTTFSPNIRFVKKNRSLHSNEQNHNNIINSYKNINNVQKHNEDKKSVVKTKHNKSLLLIGSVDQQKNVQAKIQEMVNTINDNKNINNNDIYIHNNNNNNNNLNKENQVTNTKLEIQNKKSFLCCIPLRKSRKIEKSSS